MATNYNEDDFEKRLDIKRNRDKDPLAKDPLAYVRKMVLNHADELYKQHQDFEELIAVKSRELDLLCKARDTLGDALRGTEAVRVEIQEALEGPKGYETTDQPAEKRPRVRSEY
jgi:hypothetical protein